MVKIVIENLGKKEVHTNDLTSPVLHLLQSAFIDWMHACGGKGRCTTCAMCVEEGMENLSPPTPPEQRYLERGALTKNERLACQATLNGDVRVSVPDDYKLPHLRYT